MDACLIKMDLEIIIPLSVEWDKDVQVDLVLGDEDGRVALVRNTRKKNRKFAIV